MQSPPGRLILGVACGLSFLPVILSCGNGATNAGPSSTAETASAKPSAARPAPSGSASAAAAAPSSSSAPAGSASAAAATASITAEDFCAQAAKLGDDNLAKCADSEKANVPSMGHVKNLATAKDECSIRMKSANVEFHGDAAAKCIDAAKKHGGMMTFFRFDELPECGGVLTGKATDGQPANYAEECASGFALFGNHCQKPGALHAVCADYTGGLLSKADDHHTCDASLDCFVTKEGSDGNADELHCEKPSDAGAMCQLGVNTCPRGSSCYQGKCRPAAAAGGDCMAPRDCGPNLACEIKGGAFGKCADRAAVPETCH